MNIHLNNYLTTNFIQLTHYSPGDVVRYSLAHRWFIILTKAIDKNIDKIKEINYYFSFGLNTNFNSLLTIIINQIPLLIEDDGHETEIQCHFYVYGLNRMGLEAIDLYRKMPHHLCNEVTYVCVLNACSHSGLLNEAHSIFSEILQKNKQVITMMVNCLSLAILSGARNSHQHILSRKIYDRMNILFPDKKERLKSGSILLGNTYSSVGDYQEAVNIRSKRIRELGTKVKPGVSWTEFNDEILEFKANDRSHPQSKEIHAKAKYISDVLIKYGYNYDSSWITRPLREDEIIEFLITPEQRENAEIRSGG
ncbi:unnamed protein product [Rotaria sordida]|uniref:Pentatricopeptide repeat-containing protein n=1 Tax=Rotaria sordida TaxID=392033 RepID=A0A819RAI6_9BILA|nr:unnamed protein product [Rotaria sordida]